MPPCRSCRAVGRCAIGAAPADARKVWMHQRSGLPGADEGEHAADQLIPRELLLDPREAIAEDALAEEQGLVGAAHTVDVGARKAAPAHPDHVKPVEHGALTDGEPKRDDIGPRPADA